MFDGVSRQVEGILVPPVHLPHWFPRVCGHLQRMADESEGRFWREDIEERLLAGDFQMWIVLDGPEIRSVLLTELLQFPRMRVCRFVGCVGRFWRDWLHLHAFVEGWARGQGCQRVEALTHGWKFRHMLPGFVLSHVLFLKDL